MNYFRALISRRQEDQWPARGSWDRWPDWKQAFAAPSRSTHSDQYYNVSSAASILGGVELSKTIEEEKPNPSFFLVSKVLIFQILPFIGASF